MTEMGIADGNSVATIDDQHRRVHVERRDNGESTRERAVLTTLTNISFNGAYQAHFWIGSGNRSKADQAAVNGMAAVLGTEFCDHDLPGLIVSGEGERDEAPMLYEGESFGPAGEVRVKFAVDPLEGTNPAAEGQPNAISVIAAAILPDGDFHFVPDAYFYKLVVAEEAKGLMRIGDVSTGEPFFCYLSSNLRALADAYGIDIRDVVVMVLDRPRNRELITGIRDVGAQARTFPDGDITAGWQAVNDEHDVHAYMGIGAAPEGLIGSAITSVHRGEMYLAPWIPTPNDKEWGNTPKDVPREQHPFYRQFVQAGLEVDRVYRHDELAIGTVMYSMTFVTDTLGHKGIKALRRGGFFGETIYGRSGSGTWYSRLGRHPNPPERLI